MLSLSGHIISTWVPSVAPTTWGIKHSVKTLNFCIFRAVSLSFLGNEINSGARWHTVVQNSANNLHAVDRPILKTLLVALYELPVDSLQIATAILFSTVIASRQKVFCFSMLGRKRMTIYSNVSVWSRNYRFQNSW